MRRNFGMRSSIVTVAVGLLLLNLGFAAGFFLTFSGMLGDRGYPSLEIYKALLIVVNLLWFAICFSAGRAGRSQFKNYFLFLFIYFGVIVFLQANEFSRLFHLCFLALFGFGAVVLEYARLGELVEIAIWRSTRAKRVVLIGDSSSSAEPLLRHLGNLPGNYECFYFFSPSVEPLRTGRTETTADPARVFKMKCGRLEELETVLEKNTVDEILISASSLSLEEIERVLKIGELRHITASLVPPFFEFLSEKNFRIKTDLGLPVLSVFSSDMARLPNRFLKRVFDIFFALFILTTVFPLLFLVVMPLISGTSRGSVFFRQIRKGYRQEPFICWKFRTMILNSAIPETAPTRPQDPRVTLIGRVLRKTSLDELPQFINVLRGEMSIVGPRPHMVEHDEFYDKLIERYNVRFAAKPGITGWAQVNGLRGSSDDPEMMRSRIEYDLWYIKNWSPWLDLKIMAMTVLKILGGDRNAY